MELDFFVLAPEASKVDFVVCKPDPGREHSTNQDGLGPVERIPMQRVGTRGYWRIEIPPYLVEDNFTNYDGQPNYGYMVSIDDRRLVSDPRAPRQPWDWDGPSALVPPSKAPDLDRDNLPSAVGRLIREIHVGTANEWGTLRSLIPEIPDYVKHGFTSVQLMALNGFPGKHNWGYDTANVYAIDETYGGPAALDEFVAASHEAGLEVILDVVWNHIGPENTLGEFECYLAGQETPWGGAPDFSKPEVRQFYINSAIYFLFERKVDGIRLDAAHQISPPEYGEVLFRELRAAIAAKEQETGTKKWIIAEVDAPDAARWTDPVTKSGRGLDAVLVDEPGHAAMTFLTPREPLSWLIDYGSLKEFAAALRNGGFAYTGQISQHRGRPYGVPYDPREISAGATVANNETHDHTGNLPDGTRPAARVSHDDYVLTQLILGLTFRNLLVFMGNEYGSRNKWQFFTDFRRGSACALGCRIGRPAEFIDFARSLGISLGPLTKPEVEEFVRKHMNMEDPENPFSFAQSLDPGTLSPEDKNKLEFCKYAALLPNPQDRQTFLDSQLSARERRSPRCRNILAAFKAMAEIRRHPELFGDSTEAVRVQLDETKQTLIVQQPGGLLIAANLAQVPRTITIDNDSLRLRPDRNPQLLLATKPVLSANWGAQVSPGEARTVRIPGSSLVVLNAWVSDITPHEYVDSRRIVAKWTDPFATPSRREPQITHIIDSNSLVPVSHQGGSAITR